MCKSSPQVKKWRNAIIQAILEFTAVVGVHPIGDISREDMRSFRDWWIERIAVDGVKAATANKNMDHVGKVLKLVNEELGLGLTLPLGSLRLKEGEKVTRPPFSVAWIRDRLLAPGALDGLTPEARAVLLIMVNTGTRPSEITALTEKTIRLRDSVPHISIEPEGRLRKTNSSRRVIPLIGTSLEAASGFPAGFSHYHGGSALSKDIGDELTATGLRETPRHSLYSLRHSFEDRMLHAGFDDRIRRDLMATVSPESAMATSPRHSAPPRAPACGWTGCGSDSRR
ncbi:MAG: hypothetical protein WAT09_10100 [Paracoccaceae bacterium]